MRLELIEPVDPGIPSPGITLPIDEYIPVRVAATRGELWMAFLDESPLNPQKISDVVPGQKVKIPLTGDRSVRLYLVSHDPTGKRAAVDLSTAEIRDVNPNREAPIPVIYLASDAENTTATLGVTNYTPTAKYRKTEVAFDVNFTQGLETFVDNVTNQALGLSTSRTITRTVNATYDNDLTTTKKKYFRVSHSSNGIEYGTPSDVLEITYADSAGNNGSTAGSSPSGGSGSPPVLGNLTFSGGTVTGSITNGGGTGTIRIWRKIDGGTYGEIASGTPSAMVASGLSDSSLTTNGTYWYKLTQDGVTGESEPKSVVVTGFGSGATAPTWGGIFYNTVGVDKFQLNWTPNGGSGGYTIEMREGGMGGWGTGTTAAAGATSANIYYSQPGDDESWEFRIKRDDVNTGGIDDDGWQYSDAVMIFGTGP